MEESHHDSSSAQSSLLTHYIQDLLGKDDVSIKFTSKKNSVVISLKEVYGRRSGKEKTVENISGDFDKASIISSLFSNGKEICFNFPHWSDTSDGVCISPVSYIYGAPLAKPSTRNGLKHFYGNDESKFKELSLYIVKALSVLGVDKYRAIKQLLMDETRFHSFKTILNLKSDNIVISYRPSPDRLVIKGQVITMSKIKEIIEGIESPKPKTIDVFCLEKMIVDTVLSNSRSELQLIIIAPQWEIIDSQEIILDGPPGVDVYPPKAPEADGSGVKGQNGASGDPGGPGGYFLGIGGKFINGKALRISANGGVGSDGQDGGNGSKGTDGEMPSATKFSDAEEWRAEGYVVNRIFHKQKRIRHFYARVEDVYEVYGTNGTKGGDGGDGGGGGAGGSRGTVSLIGLNSDSDITDDISCIDGADGRSGVGGAGGLGGASGWSILVKSTQVKSPFVSKRHLHVLKKQQFGGEAPHGNPGLSGQVNAANRKINKFPNPSFAVNAYKSFFRYNLKKNTNDTSLMNYFDKLENNDLVNGLYDTIGFVDELRSLEEQYHRLNEEVPLLPFYQSLLKRTASYAIKPKDYEKGNKDSDQYKKVLCYLYTATMSKISSLSNGPVGNLVIDMKGYLDVVAGSIKRLKESTLEVAKDEFNYRHNLAISDKIERVNDFLNAKIVPEISRIFDQLDKETHYLIAEVISLQKQARKGIQMLKEKQEKLKKVIIIRRILEIVSVAASFLTLVGPVGSATTKLISSGMGIVESLISGNQREGINKIPSAVNDGLKLMGEILKKHPQKILEQLNDIKQELDLISDNEPALDLNKVKEKINEIKKRMEQETAKGEYADPAVMENLRRNLGQTLFMEKTELEKQSAKRSKPALKKLETIQFLLSILLIPLNTYERIRGDKEKIRSCGKVAKQVEGKLRALKWYELGIYKLIIPLFRNLKTYINSVNIHLKEGTGFSLEVKKWDIQAVLAEIKFKMSDITSSFLVNGTIEHHLTRLQDAMTTMINMYQQIEHYRDEAELYAYIGHIGSSDMTTIKMDNEELERVLLELEQMVRSNIVLDHYQRATSTFMQYVFPLAHVYLPELALPKAESTEGLVFSAVTKIENLRNGITESAVTISKYDRFIHTGVKFTRDQGRSPFYVWDHATNKDAISKLFRGEEVSLVADVTKSYNNAIKFNEVGIRVRVSNGTSQDQLDRVLNDFSVTMIHSGNSYYRCGSKIYTMSSDSQAIEYSFQKNKRGDPIDMNLVYRKIRDNDFMLSPYTVWSIQLSNVSGGFDRLESFADDHIDLELEGRGQYVERGLFDKVVCKDNLKAYYRLDGTAADEGSKRVGNSYSASYDQEDYVHSSLDEDVEEYNSVSISDDHHNSEVEFNGSTARFEDWKYTLDHEELPADISATNAQDSKIFASITRMLNPGRWFHGRTIDPRELAPIASSRWTNLARRIADDSPLSDEQSGLSLTDTHGNILLWDLLIRKFSGPSHNASRKCGDADCEEYASRLAYNHYIQ